MDFAFFVLRIFYRAEDKQRRSSIFAFLVSHFDMSHVLTFDWMADMFGNAGGTCCSPIWSRIEMNGCWMKLIILNSLLCTKLKDSSEARGKYAQHNRDAESVELRFGGARCIRAVYTEDVSTGGRTTRQMGR